jgi:hypothetical protein
VLAAMQILQQQQPAPLGEPARMFASHGNIGQVLLQICTTRCKKVTFRALWRLFSNVQLQLLKVQAMMRLGVLISF